MLDILRQQLLSGMLASLGIFFLTLIFSLPLGLVITFIRRSKLKVLNWIARIYISIMRGTPLYAAASCSIFRTVLSFSECHFLTVTGFTL